MIPEQQLNGRWASLRHHPSDGGMDTAYGLGIDTGGTYTDTVIIDLGTGDILCSSKSLTTRDDLSRGIRGSLAGLDRELLKKVSLTSLSSTLATNSVVENKGCRVGLICIGISYRRTSEPEFYAEAGGKFDMSGNETESLDVRAVKKALEEMKGKVDAVAVSGYVSVRNPSHELRTARMARRILGVPTVCGHELTSKLGFELRTTTAVMNARLIPVIKELLTAVKQVMAEFGIDSPLMMVKGDGAVMKDETALLKPVETILSGPASSLIGAKTLTGRNDAVMVDMGGTTSDVGVLKNGFPRMEPEGARIGGRRTRVMAADVAAFGIGGDSRIAVNGKDVILSPVRAVPLCIAASVYPGIREKIMSLDGASDRRSPEHCREEDIVQDTEFFMLAHTKDRTGLPDTACAFLDLLKDGPARISDAAEILGVPPHAVPAGLLESRGYVTRIGVTPTDLLHADGSYTEYDAEISKAAVKYLAAKCSVSPEDFLGYTENLVVKKIAACVMEKILLDRSGKDVLSESQSDLIRDVLRGDAEDYSVGFFLKHPIIGIGAPVRAWLPGVAEYLHAELILPEHSEIGNAVGAITGSVSETVSVTVRACGTELIEDPECNVFTGKEIKTFQLAHDALEYARREASRLAEEEAAANGAKNPVVEITSDEKYAEVSPEKRYFRGATVTARATGKPDFS